MNPKTSDKINQDKVGKYILFIREKDERYTPPAEPPKYAMSPGWRWLAWHSENKRMEMTGYFTAEDLRNLAEWMDNPEHPVIAAGVPVIDVKLSPLI